jgi:beta-xylosidase
MNLEKLTPDFYHIVNNTLYVFPETFIEAPVLFKTNGTYYALYDWCCCFCMQGSGILVYRADSPMGPYTQQVGSVLCSCFSLETRNT